MQKSWQERNLYRSRLFQLINYTGLLVVQAHESPFLEGHPIGEPTIMTLDPNTMIV